MVNTPPDTSDAPADRSLSAAGQPPGTSPSTADDAPETQQQSVTTWDGFQAFATTPVAAPPPPGAPPRSLAERLVYHSRFVTVRTPAIDILAKNVRTLMVLGRHPTVTARPSLIVVGPAGAGKTTALLQVGRACHLAHTRRNGPPAAAGQVPVAYVLVPPAASAKTLATEFARYLGIPVAAGMSQVQITNSACHTYTAARVQLVMIDDVHRLNPRTTTGAQTADLLKDLTDASAPPSSTPASTSPPHPCSPECAAPSSPDAPPSSTVPPSSPASATKSPSATSPKPWKAHSTCATTGPEPSPSWPRTCTSAPPGPEGVAAFAIRPTAHRVRPAVGRRLRPKGSRIAQRRGRAPWPTPGWDSPDGVARSPVNSRCARTALLTMIGMCWSSHPPAPTPHPL
ncbi:TniB family NTP-binding protein [Streptomyces hygroscopicus]